MCMNTAEEAVTTVDYEIASATGTASTGVHWAVHAGDAVEVLKTIPNETFDCVITSPPYFWLRDYGVQGQIGLERTVEDYVEAISLVMDQVLRVLKRSGILFLNVGDTYYSGKGKSHGVDKKSRKRRFGLRAVDKSGGMGIGLKPKSLIGIPWRLAISMIGRGWTLRSDIIWYRKHSLPESVRDRPRRSYEHIFMFVRDRKYYFNRQPLVDEEQEDMWTIVARPKPTNGISTAPFPDELVQRCLDVGCRSAGNVLDPFAGAGTTLRVAVQSGRNATGIDLNPDFCAYMIGQLRSV
jgi:DNA modification methylase